MHSMFYTYKLNCYSKSFGVSKITCSQKCGPTQTRPVKELNCIHCFASFSKTKTQETTPSAWEITREHLEMYIELLNMETLGYRYIKEAVCCISTETLNMCIKLFKLSLLGFDSWVATTPKSVPDASSKHLVTTNILAHTIHNTQTPSNSSNHQ